MKGYYRLKKLLFSEILLELVSVGKKIAKKLMVMDIYKHLHFLKHLNKRSGLVYESGGDMRRLVFVLFALAISFAILIVVPVVPAKADTGPISLIAVAEQIASNLKYQYSFETLIVIENDQIAIYGWKPRASLSKSRTNTAILPSSPPDLKIIVGAYDVWR